jgi:16S rRNA (cytosine1402-N4)-methyltransferase
LAFPEKKSASDSSYHRPVLADTAAGWLVTNPSGVYVDCTAGGGSHSAAVLARLDAEGRMLLIDRDRAAVDACAARFGSDGRIRVIQGEFGEIASILESQGIQRASGFLFDLGLSSHQIDTGERGFSYSGDCPLDMRMDVRSGRTAADIINTYSENELADIFFYHGEERKARGIARKVVAERKKGPIETSSSLNAVVRKTVPGKWLVKSLSRIYQALRIEVNDELNQLKKGLEGVLPFLDPGGRVVVVSYHSLEDRIVKHFFKGDPAALFGEGFEKTHPRFLFKNLTKKVVRPSSEEIGRNPRARSAKLRAAEKSLDG